MGSRAEGGGDQEEAVTGFMDQCCFLCRPDGLINACCQCEIRQIKVIMIYRSRPPAVRS